MYLALFTVISLSLRPLSTKHSVAYHLGQFRLHSNTMPSDCHSTTDLPRGTLSPSLQGFFAVTSAS